MMPRPQPQQALRQQKQTDAVLEEQISPYRHYTPGEKPRTDQAYFELLLANNLKAAGDLQDFETIWPQAVQALAGMNLLRLSTYSPVEVADAVSAAGGVFATRMSAKSALIVEWATAFWRIRQIYGSFRQYVRSFETEGFEALLNDLRGRLTGLTPVFLGEFLKAAGEKAPQQDRPVLPVRSPQIQKATVASMRDTTATDRGQLTEASERPDRRRQKQRQRGVVPRDQSSQPRQENKSRPAQATAASQTEVQSVAANEAPQDGQGTARRRRNRRFFRRNRRGSGKSGTQSGTPTESGTQ